jgi:hypothetical protein
MTATSGDPSEASRFEKSGRRVIPFHPWLLALLTPLLILAQNGLEIAPGQAVRSVVFELLFASLVWLGCRLATGEWRRSALVASAVLLVFHAYGRFYAGSGHSAVQALPLVDRLAGNHALLLPLAMAVLAFLAFAVSRLHRFTTGMTNLLNIVSLTLCLVTAGTIALLEWRLAQAPGHAEFPIAQTVSGERAPDIYYLVLDGYGRVDVLADLYRFDNQPFLRQLESSGFTVASGAHANYMQTSLSLASSLNLEYLQSIVKAPATNDTGQARLQIQRWLRHNRLAADLERRGYQLVAMESGYRPTQLAGAQLLGPSSAATNLLERLMIENSGLTLLQAFAGMPDSLRRPGYDLHRQRVDYAFAALQAGLPASDRPRFVFVHILVPHPPFVFNSVGQPTWPPYPYVLLDGDAYPADPADYPGLYRDQLTYVNQRLTEALAGLLKNGGRRALIVVQGDHGPGSGLDWDSLARTDARERFGILLAVRPPDGSSLDPGLIETPVNVFRWALAGLFGADFPLLPDNSYYSTWLAPLAFQQVPSGQMSPPGQ